jgi:hypothetical protein
MDKNNPYYYIDNVSYKKEELDENGILSYYHPFLTNRSLSYHVDSLIHANEMNMRHHLDKDMQYAFFLNSLRARKRLAKWSKKEHEDKLKSISEHFNYSYTKASQVLDLINNEQLDVIKNYNDNAKGGLEK